MLHTKIADGSVAEVVERLHAAVAAHEFGVLGQIDLQAKMVEKGVPFDHPCVVLEVCNPHQAKRVLETNMDVSTALPCRISVYEEAGRVTIATIKPTAMIAMYEGHETILPVAQDVERTLVSIIADACRP
jgi:uncharacterized protein (DUF302 family)